MSHNLRFFDCNCMVSRNLHLAPQPMRLETKAQALQEMDEHGIEEAMIYNASAKEGFLGPSWSYNASVLDWCRGEERLHPAWVVPLDYAFDMPDPEKGVQDMIDRGVRMAITPPCRDYPYVVNEWLCGGVLAALERHRVPVLLCSSDLARSPFERWYGVSLENIDWIAGSYPQLPVILAGVGGAPEVLSPLVKRRPNLYIEISRYRVCQPIRFLKEHMGIERVLFGSGMPITGPGPAMTEVHYAPISEQEKRMVAGDNLRRLITEVR